MNWKQYSDHLKVNLSLENAKEWEAEQDKYAYCVDFLDISAWDDNADKLVSSLESKFEKLLKKEKSEKV